METYPISGACVRCGVSPPAHFASCPNHPNHAGRKAKTTPDDVRSSILDIVLYCWADEEQDYAENPSPDHIYLDLVRVKEWLVQNDRI